MLEWRNFLLVEILVNDHLVTIIFIGLVKAIKQSITPISHSDALSIIACKLRIITLQWISFLNDLEDFKKNHYCSILLTADSFNSLDSLQVFSLMCQVWRPVGKGDVDFLNDCLAKILNGSFIFLSNPYGPSSMTIQVPREASKTMDPFEKPFKPGVRKEKFEIQVFANYFWVVLSVASSMKKSSIERARACSKIKIRVLSRVEHAWKSKFELEHARALENSTWSSFCPGIWLKMDYFCQNLPIFKS